MFTIENCKLKIENYDLIHYPYFDPFKLTLPKTTSPPTVVTVHDLIPRQFKSHFPVGFKGYLKWLIQKNKLESVSQIITVSHFSKKIIKVPKFWDFLFDKSHLSVPEENS